VAVQFTDEQAEEARNQIQKCLINLPKLIGIAPKEFHFKEIYNHSGEWRKVTGDLNLKVFAFFAEIYRRYRWPVYIQTIDDRTLIKDRFTEFGVVDGIDLTSREGKALMFILLKIRHELFPPTEKIVIRIDEGHQKSNTLCGSKIFSAWHDADAFDGRYASSAEEPLIQIADFLAYSINRSTYLSLKSKRTDADTWFLNMIGHMHINSPDARRETVPVNFSKDDLDAFHAADRKEKGIE
jgi:hypothetical protein